MPSSIACLLELRKHLGVVNTSDDPPEQVSCVRFGLLRLLTMLDLPTKLYVFHPCRSNMISRMFNHDNLKVPWMAKFMVMDVGIPVDQKEIICPD